MLHDIVQQALKLNIKPEFAESLDERIAILLTNHHVQYTEIQAQKIAAMQILKTYPHSRYVRAIHFIAPNQSKAMCGTFAKSQNMTYKTNQVTCKRCLKQLKKS